MYLIEKHIARLAQNILVVLRAIAEVSNSFSLGAPSASQLPSKGQV